MNKMTMKIIETTVKFWLKRLILTASVALVLLLCSAANAATLTVTSTGDTTVGAAGCADGCSLREAITAAAAGDTINFSSLFNTAQTINITSQLPTIGKNLIITGTGARLLTVRRSTATNYRIFDIIAGTVRISGMTISNGSDSAGGGGGVTTAGTSSVVTLDGVTVSGTSSISVAAVDNLGGTLTILNSTISNNSTIGVASEGTAVNIANSTISGNNGTSVGVAGGIYNSTTLNLNNVTVANNVNGGIENFRTTNIRNTIITGSTGRADAVGGFTSQGNNLVSNLGTATGFSAASGDKLNVAANLAALANNGGQTDTHRPNAGSPAIDAGNNCVVTASCGTNNPPVALTTDQRGAGFPRQSGTAVDIGAFEVQAAPAAPVVTAPANNSTVATRRPTYTGTAEANSTVTIYVDSTSIGTTTATSSGTFSLTQPTDLAGGSHTVYATATNANGTSPNSNSNTFTVSIPTITVNPATLPNGTAGTAYSQTITASGGTAPYSFAVTAGALPNGLTLTTGGALSGTPTTAATFNFTVTATDANGNTGSRTYTITIAAAPPPQTFVVDTTSDDAALNACTTAVNDCSLRGAISNANATAANDAINFAIPATNAGCANGVCTITLGGNQLTVISAATAGTLTITNAAGTSKLIVSGNNQSRVFNLDPGGDLTLDGLTITGGSGNGTIGGGIYNGGTLAVTNSTVTGNSSGSSGGGIVSNGTLTVTNSTISDNTAIGNGGGIAGGGTMTITNSTISNNSAIIGNFTDLRGGGSFGGGIDIGSVTLTNTIIAKNDSTSNPDIRGTVTSTSSYNLIGDGAGASGISNGTNSNQVGTSAAPIDPLLGNLADNGGRTRTRALQTGSPAIDKGNSTLTTDQRGSTRPYDNPAIANASGGNGADIGAFEVQAPPTAAGVTISGRVTLPEDLGLTNALVTLTDMRGETRTVRTGKFGSFRFAEVAAGETYILSVQAKRYQYAPQIITANEDLTEINFTALY